MAEQILLSKEIQKLRRLTNNEKRLLSLLGIALFVMANFYGVSYLLDNQAALIREVDELKSTRRSNDIWLREKDLWLARKQWIEKTQPKTAGSQRPQADLLEALTRSAKDHQLTIEEQSFGESRSTPNYNSVAVRLKMSGSLENVVKWLVAIQQPEVFHAVTSFSLKSANEPPTVSLELEVARWYAPNA
jgi:hypothetical protein